MKNVFKVFVLAIVLLAITSCGPSEREILLKENAKTMAEMEELTQDMESLNVDFQRAVELYEISFEPQYEDEMESIKNKMDKLGLELDSIHKVIESQLSKIPKK